MKKLLLATLLLSQSNISLAVSNEDTDILLKKPTHTSFASVCF